MRNRNFHFALENFKIFEERESFEFSPLTILTGPNNSGKSSVLKALVFAYRNRNFLTLPERNLRYLDYEEYLKLIADQGDNVDFEIDGVNLHNFEATAHSSEHPISFDLKINNFYHEQVNANFAKYALSRDLEPVYKVFLSDSNGKLLVRGTDHKVEINVEYIVNLALNKLKSDYFSNGFYHNNFLLNEFLKPTEIEKVETIFNQITDQAEYISLAFDTKLRNENNIPLDENIIIPIEISEEHEQLQNYSSFENLLHELMEDLFFKTRFSDLLKEKNLNYKEVNQINGELNFLDIFKVSIIGSIIKNLNIVSRNTIMFDKFIYVPAFKTTQERYIDLSKYPSLAKALYEKRVQQNYQRSTQIRKVEAWLLKLGYPYTVEVEDHIEMGIIEIKLDGRPIQDFGTGIAQLVHLFVMAAAIHPNWWENEMSLFPDDKKSYPHWLLVEEPEANLHPNLQSKLAEIFAEIVDYGINLIVETHSEYLIRKLQLLVAKKELDKENVCIYYFKDRTTIKNESESLVKRIEINERGSLSDNFGTGFIDEANNIMLDLMRYNNKHQEN